MGEKNFPSVTQREFLEGFWGGAQKYKKDIGEYLKNIDINEIGNITLELGRFKN